MKCTESFDQYVFFLSALRKHRSNNLYTYDIIALIIHYIESIKECDEYKRFLQD